MWLDSITGPIPSPGQDGFCASQRPSTACRARTMGRSKHKDPWEAPKAWGPIDDDAKRKSPQATPEHLFQVVLDALFLSFANSHAFLRLASSGGWLHDSRDAILNACAADGLFNYFGLAQAVIGPILLFLVLLTLRNRFRLGRLLKGIRMSGLSAQREPLRMYGTVRGHKLLHSFGRVPQSGNRTDSSTNGWNLIRHAFATLPGTGISSTRSVNVRL